MRFFDVIRKGAEPNVWGGTPGPASTRWIPFGWQPGSHFDYQTSAGDLWLNGAVMMGLRFKACAMSEMRPVAQEFSEKDRKWVESNKPAAREWLKAFTEPTDDYDWSVLLGSLQLSDDVNGNSFLIKREDGLNRFRKGYRYEPHFLFEAASNDKKKLVAHYIYGEVGGATRELLDVKNVVHIRQMFINPRERRLGLTPLAAVLRDVCSDNELTNWLAAILRNGAMPSHLLSPKSDADPSFWNNNRASVRDLFKKFVRDARGDVMTAPSPMDVVKLMWSPKELEIAELQQGPSSRILGALGVDPMCVGLPSANKTYSNFSEAVDACGKLTILPTCRRWMKQFSQQCAPDFGLDPAQFRIWLATDTVSWLQDETDSLHDRVRKDFVANMIDLARAKEMIGETPKPEDTGVYSWMLKPAPVVGGGASATKSHADRVRRSHEALKGLV